VEYGFGGVDELMLAYATTIHSAQGSEYPGWCHPADVAAHVMLARKLLYTGVARASNWWFRSKNAKQVGHGGEKRRTPRRPCSPASHVVSNRLGRDRRGMCPATARFR
jgi:exodeoxyribonuclease V alpha subunit